MEGQRRVHPAEEHEACLAGDDRFAEVTHGLLFGTEPKAGRSAVSRSSSPAAGKSRGSSESGPRGTMGPSPSRIEPPISRGRHSGLRWISGRERPIYRCRNQESSRGHRAWITVRAYADPQKTTHASAIQPRQSGRLVTGAADRPASTSMGRIAGRDRTRIRGVRAATPRGGCGTTIASRRGRRGRGRGPDMQGWSASGQTF